MSLRSLTLFFLTLAIGLGVESVGACVEGAAWRTMSEGRVLFRSADGATHHLAVKVAATPAQRSAGFQYICSDWVRIWGILFVFPTSQRFMFHMRNVSEDLDIAFIAEDGRILELMEMRHDERSDDSRTYRAAQPYRYALEAAAGRLFALGFDDGNWWLVLDPAWI